jgi:16S rRNA (uracil1498-N3)-methyltransferase
MRLTRVYVTEPLTAGVSCTIGGDAANHISRVLRLRVGDSLTLFDGRGGEYAAKIAAFGKGSVRVEVGEHQPVSRESPLDLTLAQGVSRGERMDWVIQKATELGVRTIIPVLTERTVVRLDAQQAERKLQHWRGIAIAACEQSGRDRLPDVSAPIHLSDFLRAVPADAKRVMLSPSGTRHARDLSAPAGRLVVLIGPEGGLAEGEQEAAMRAGFESISLGPRILRTETAAVAALTLLQDRFGDL